LDSDAVLSRIEQLRSNPDLFEWGAKGLCPAAHFYRNLAHAKPDEFADFARTLYSSGLAFLGNRKVSPSAAVRNVDYGQLAVAGPHVPPQAEWMLMCALRNSESWLTGAEGLDAAGVLRLATQEYAEFYESTGWYRRVEFNSDTTLDAIGDLDFRPDSTVVTFWLRAGGLTPIMGPVLMYTVPTPPFFDPDSGRTIFGFWQSGRSDPATWNQPTSDFEAIYLGATVATLA
jgi:hypothetical protein